MYHVKIFWIDGMVTESDLTPDMEKALDFGLAQNLKVIRRIEVHYSDNLGVRTIYCAQEAA